ncbi:hypothetical protein NL676_006384 [Syzygium grande]|nr:hypothetical protein NL676_006384 [Syzygium grande]
MATNRNRRFLNRDHDYLFVFKPPLVVGTIVAALMHLGTAWWLMNTVPNIFNWALIGPRRIFGDLGFYSSINWFFLVGVIAPFIVWLAHKAFPNKGWIRLITMPVLLGTTVNMPPATAVNYTSWIIAGFLSAFLAYRCY